MSLICPACRKVYLKSQTDPGTNLEIDICPKCNGMWFDANELSVFFQSSTLKRKFFLSEDAAPLDSIGYVMTTKVRGCPRCREAMTEKLFGDVSIDICQNCQGLWLDDGELQRMVLQFKKGERGEKTVAQELSKGLKGSVEKPSLQEVVNTILAFFGKA